jgi:mannose-6-phosphate isomerase-like protein (cupin superfamily)
MKPVKYSKSDANRIDLGTKVIYKYPAPDKLMDIGIMFVNGRHPEGENTFILEHDCNFVMYITKGNGIIYAGDESFEVVSGDVVYIPKENRFAVEGQFEYITVDTPAFYPEQSETINFVG